MGSIQIISNGIDIIIIRFYRIFRVAKWDYPSMSEIPFHMLVVGHSYELLLVQLLMVHDLIA